MLDKKEVCSYCGGYIDEEDLYELEDLYEEYEPWGRQSNYTKREYMPWWEEEDEEEEEQEHHCCQKEEAKKVNVQKHWRNGNLVFVVNADVDIEGDINVQDNLRDNNIIKDILSNNLNDSIKDILSHNLSDNLSHNFNDSFKNFLNDNLRDFLNDNLSDNFKNFLNDNLSDNLKNFLNDNLSDNLKNFLNDNLSDNFNGNEDNFKNNMPIANQVSESSSCASSHGLIAVAEAENKADVEKEYKYEVPWRPALLEDIVPVESQTSGN